jgi:hypothetical protein
MKEIWTVIGLWVNDEPVPVGVVKGSHDVYGGEAVDDGYDSPVNDAQSMWAVDVEAEDWETAETLAVEVMADTLDRDDEEDEDDDEPEIDGVPFTAMTYEQFHTWSAEHGVTWHPVS